MQHHNMEILQIHKINQQVFLKEKISKPKRLHNFCYLKERGKLHSIKKISIQLTRNGLIIKKLCQNILNNKKTRIMKRKTIDL